MKDAIERLRTAFADYGQGRAANQPRRRLILPNGSVLHSMAGAWGGYLGTKVYTTNPEYGANFTFLLYDAETARPLAQFEANSLGQIRTGAVSGLAVDLLTPAEPLAVGCIGSGYQAAAQLEAIAAVRAISSVQVWSRDGARAEEFAKRVTSSLAVEVSTASSAEAAAEGREVLVTATSAKEPVISAESVPKRCLVLAMGSNQPRRRELPGDLVKRSYVVVDDKEACQIEAGDLIMPFSEEDWENVTELRSLITSTPDRQERTKVFKSVGLGLEDVAAAAFVWEQAARR